MRSGNAGGAAVVADPDRSVAMLAGARPLHRPGDRDATVTACMDMTVADTLQAIAELRLPVVRTCHFGNTPANNLGWMGLCANTYFGPLDHTLYGVDDIFYPWAVLGDGGVVTACFDHRGEPVAEPVGLHANVLRRSIPRKYCSFFNYGIFADHGGEDLILHHHRLTAELAHGLNGSATVTRAAEALALRPLLSGIIRHFHAKRQLDALFNKWVRTTRRGYALMLKIARIEYPSAADVVVYTTDSARNFEGSVEALIDAFFAGLELVSERFTTGRRYDALSYPWITVFLNLMLNVIKEHAVDPSQRVFWHTSAATNHLYMQEPWFRRGLSELVRALEESGHVPAGAELRMVPTHSCQLFATQLDALGALEGLISCWREYLAGHRRRIAEYLAAFATAANPSAVVGELWREIEPRFVTELGRRLAQFNSLDRHRLPVAYLPGSDHPTYNKYGIAQAALRGHRMLFPGGFTAMTWGEAELLTKTLAQLVIDERG